MGKFYFGVVRRVGDGTDTLVWGWRWLADSADPNLQSECIDELKEAKVCNLFNENGDWDERWFELGLAFGLTHLFETSSINQTCKIVSSCFNHDNKKIQKHVKIHTSPTLLTCYYALMSTCRTVEGRYAIHFGINKYRTIQAGKTKIKCQNHKSR